MTITVQCEQCGKSFAIPDHLAGRRGRCDQCGHVFWLSANDESAVNDNQSASGVAVEQRVTSAASHAAATSILVNAPALMMVPTPERQRRSGELFRFPKTKLLDVWLAPLLILVGFGLAIAYVANSYTHVRLVALLMYVVMVVPAAFCGAALAAKKLKFELPEFAGVRMAAVMAVPLGLTCAVVLPLDVWDSYALAGWLVGTFPAFFVFWFLYRLTGREAIIGFTCAMVLAMLVGCGAGWGLDLAIRSTLHH